MCVIIHLPPTKKIPETKLWNAVCNNWHGWGLGLWAPKEKKLDIVRSIPENCWLDEKDPEAGGNHAEFDKIVESLISNEDKHRFLHLRHATRGRVNLDNCHPVSLYNTPKRQVYLMHNGQFHYGLGDSRQVESRVLLQGYSLPDRPGSADGTGLSDTVDFCKSHLIDPLTEFVKGDYQNPTFLQHVWARLWEKYGSNSRALIFSNDLEPLKAGSWDGFKGEDGEIEYWASNNMYFDRVQRGPIFQEGVREREKQQAEARASLQTREETKEKKEVGNGEIKMIAYEPGIFQIDPMVQKGLANLLEMFGENIDSDVISCLRMCSVLEFEAMINNAVKDRKVGALAVLINHVFEQYGELFDSIEPTLRKKELAEKAVAKFKQERDAAVKQLKKLKGEQDVTDGGLEKKMA